MTEIILIFFWMSCAGFYVGIAHNSTRGIEGTVEDFASCGMELLD